MKNPEHWLAGYQRELTRGQAAREQGNEGMARVCARRAAGIVVRAYYHERGKALPGSNIMRHLKTLYESQNEPEDVRMVCRHFTLQITEDHVLPGDVDLLEDVRWLQRTLFPESAG